MEPTATASPVQAKRALLIAIDIYEIMVDLEGCKNDVEVMECMLRQQFGFTDIRKLVDKEATRAAILAAFDKLVEDTNPGDVVVIHYAGHGSQKTDLEGDEPSGLDSTLMPHDTHGRKGTPEQNLDITDDEIHLKLLAMRTSNITLIIDSCHSGTITRDADDALACTMRGEAPDTRPAAAMPTSNIPEARWPELSVDIGDKYVVISGCRDDERSGEAEVDLGNGTMRKHGALTHFLVQEMRSAGATTTYRDVFERAAAKVTAKRAGQQHPQLEGKADRVLFGLNEIEPLRALRIASRSGDTVNLDAGAVLGVTPGSKYQVFPEGTRNVDDVAALGEIEIVSVQVATSSARLTTAPFSPAIDAGCRAVLTSYSSGDVRLAVRFLLDDEGVAPAEATLLHDAVMASPLFRSASSVERPALTIRLLPARAEAASPLPEAGSLAAATWAVTGEDGQLIAPLKAISEWSAVRANLEVHARSRLVIGLENREPNSAMNGRFTMELMRQGSDGTWTVATADESSGLPVFESGAFVGVQLESNYDGEAYVTLLEVDPAGEVIQQYPPNNAVSERFIRTTTPLRLFTTPFNQSTPGSGRKIFEIPTVFPFTAERGASQQLEATDTLKLIVTSQPTSYSSLLQGPMRDDAPLDLLLKTAIGAAPVRGGRDEVAFADVGDWTTVMRPFLLRQKRSVVTSGNGDAVDIGFAKVTAPGITGTITTEWDSASNTLEGATHDDSLSRALVSSGLTVKQAMVLQGALDDSMRDAQGTEPVLGLDIAPPPPNVGQVVLSRDESGVYSWHLPESMSNRGDDDAIAPVTQRFSVPVKAVGDATRGVGAKAVNAVLKVLVYPLLQPIVGAVGQSMASKWEAANRPYRVRAFSAANRDIANEVTLDDGGWGRMAAGNGRALLLLHGPFSRTHTGFGDLTPQTLDALTTAYGGRVFGLDHFTIGHDPLRNAQQFVSMIPHGLSLDIDIVAHSRGGLVARALAERQSELGLDDRTLKVGKVILIGTPNAGTMLAKAQHLKTLLDGATTAFSLLPGEPASEAIHLIIEIIKELAVDAYKGLEGIGAMAPDSEFLKATNHGVQFAGVEYHALASNYSPNETAMMALIGSKVMKTIMPGPNDLFVPVEAVAGANGSPMFPVAKSLTLSGLESVSHFAILSSPVAQKQLLAWLGASPTSA